MLHDTTKMKNYVLEKSVINILFTHIRTMIHNKNIVFNVLELNKNARHKKNWVKLE